MGVGPSIITVGYWYPRSQRGRASTTWNVSHNLGGGIVAPIVGASLVISVLNNGKFLLMLYRVSLP